MTIQQQFRQAIRQGKGRAHLLMKSHPEIDFSAMVSDAAVRNNTFDTQCEGTRAVYLAELIDLCSASKKEKIIDRVLKQLWEERTDLWLLSQLFDLAAIFVEQGCEKAKKAIYKRYERRKMMGCSEWGIEALWKADGIEGLKHSCRLIGKQLLKEPDYWCIGDPPASCFQKSYPKINAYQELEKAAKDDPDIQRYLKWDSEPRNSKSSKRKPERRGFQFVLEWLKPECRVVSYILRNVKLTENQLKKLADEFLNEQDPARKKRFVELFGKFQYPYDPSIFLQMAKSAKRSKQWTLKTTLEPLRFFRSKEIRDFALERLKNIKSNCSDNLSYLMLLQKNYQRGDHVLLQELIDKTTNRYSFHHLSSEIIDIYRVNETSQCRGPLEAICDRVLCTYERREAVEILLQRGLLSKQIREEILFDCSMEIRELCRQSKENRKQKMAK